MKIYLFMLVVINILNFVHEMHGKTVIVVFEGSWDKID